MTDDTTACPAPAELEEQKKEETWTATILPNYALPDGLVADRLRPQAIPPGGQGVGLADLARLQAEQQPEPPPAPKPKLAAEARPEQPLWQVVAKAMIKQAGWPIPDPIPQKPRLQIAAAIEVVRDRVAPEEKPETDPILIPAWEERQRIRAELTEHARIAREGGR
jgi:hypothetical protein